jgi:hypothetical protein
MVEQFQSGADVMACHARHSGAEALFLTPSVVPLGDENTIMCPKKGDVLFGFEPKGICQHADEDCSEVAWLYHDACQPSRWVSKGGHDPTNKTGPFERVSVALNKWGEIIEHGGGFYERCSRMPRTGEQKMSLKFL